MLLVKASTSSSPMAAKRGTKEIVADLRTRAEIRQRIRKEEDRLAKQLIEAADKIEELESFILEIQETDHLCNEY